MRRLLLTFLAVCLTASLGAVPAVAANSPIPEPGTPQALITEVDEIGIFSPTPAEWAPQGKLIATSKFKLRDQIGYLNYSNSAELFPNLVNQYYFGAPAANPQNMTAADVYTVLGKNACIGGKLPCTLTLSAQRWLESTNDAMGGGHCWGFATTSAQIFNGEVPASTVGAGEMSLVDTDWSRKLTRQIARAWSTQTLVSLQDYTVTPRQAVKVLRKGLKPGVTPFVAAIRSPDGGHGVLPIALYKRGQGLFDVEVYDNNYPGRTRAFHIDTKANTFEYLMFTIPGSAPDVASGNMQLVPTEVLSGTLPCPFCPGTQEAQVAIAPVETAEPISVKVSKIGGGKLPGLKTNQPTNPDGNTGIEHFPRYTVPAGTSFEVRINASKLTTAVSTDIAVHSGNATWMLSGLEILPGSTDVITVRPKKGSLTFTSSKGTDPTIEVIDGTGSMEWAFEFGGVVLGPNEVAGVRLDETKLTTTLTTTAATNESIEILGMVLGPTGAESVGAPSVVLPTEGSITLRFGDFVPGSPTGLKGTSRTESGARTPIVFEPVVIPV